MTVVCLGSGPSLTQQDIDACRGRGLTIAVNTTYKKALWATALYAADKKWWESVDFAPDFGGLKFSIEPKHRDADAHAVHTLKNTGRIGLETGAFGLRTGANSGYQAINLAVHMGARRIILLGYDMQPGPSGEHHHHPEHVDGYYPDYVNGPAAFEGLVQPLRDLGIHVWNCSRQTAITAFPRATLQDALQ